jgi:hypothetical protein
VDDYAQTVSVLSGRCFKWVDDGAGEPTNSPEPVVASGWLQVGERWHRVGRLWPALRAAPEAWSVDVADTSSALLACSPSPALHQLLTKLKKLDDESTAARNAGK